MAPPTATPDANPKCPKKDTSETAAARLNRITLINLYFLETVEINLLIWFCVGLSGYVNATKNGVAMCLVMHPVSTVTLYILLDTETDANSSDHQKDYLLDMSAVRR